MARFYHDRCDAMSAAQDLDEAKRRGIPIVDVPDIEHPVFCWKQKLDPPHAMTRCDRKKGHTGPHSWELGTQEK